MRIEQLKYLAAVARFGSFNRAAKELHISQSALSESVQNVERELGVVLFERGRSGATMSDGGRELFPHLQSVLEAFERVRGAAGIQSNARTIRIGTVTAATVPLLTPTIREFQSAHPSIQIEVVTARESRIHEALIERDMDLGLVNYFEDDVLPGEFENTELLRGRPIACMHPASPLAERDLVHPEELAAEKLIAMRSGYLMRRYLNRLLEGLGVSYAFSADGAEMGKLMVAEGLGVAVLPDFCVVGDPLERHGEITYREIADDGRDLVLVLQRLDAGAGPTADLRSHFEERAAANRRPAFEVPVPSDS